MKKIVAWSKFENMIEDQMNSQLVKLMTEIHSKQLSTLLGKEREEQEIWGEDEEETEVQVTPTPVPTNLSDEIYMSAVYDCWIARTNFDLTTEMLLKVSLIPGVEKLIVLSRYRFFVGVGKLFNISDVRPAIEKILGKDQKIESTNLGYDGR